MANLRRGEVSAKLAGQTYTLCLTLGSLAELEAAFGVDDISGLADRFGSGRLATGDLVRLLGAGLRGGGNAITDAELSAFPAAAVGEMAAAVAELLAVTFGGAPPNPSVPQGA